MVVGSTLGLMKWKIVDTEKAKELHLEEVSGALVINVFDIPKGMSIADYIEFIQKNNIVLKEGVVAHQARAHALQA